MAFSGFRGEESPLVMTINIWAKPLTRDLPDGTPKWSPFQIDYINFDFIKQDHSNIPSSVNIRNILDLNWILTHCIETISPIHMRNVPIKYHSSVSAFPQFL